MKPKKQNWLIFGLILVVVILAGYIAMGRYNAAKQQEQLSIFEQGAQYGYEQAVMQLAQQAATCQQVPLYVGNQSINLVAVECLQAAQQQQQVQG